MYRIQQHSHTPSFSDFSVQFFLLGFFFLHPLPNHFFSLTLNIERSPYLSNNLLSSKLVAGTVTVLSSVDDLFFHTLSPPICSSPLSTWDTLPIQLSPVLQACCCHSDCSLLCRWSLLSYPLPTHSLLPYCEHGTPYLSNSLLFSKLAAFTVMVLFSSTSSSSLSWNSSLSVNGASPSSLRRGRITKAGFRGTSTLESNRIVVWCSKRSRGHRQKRCCFSPVTRCMKTTIKPYTRTKLQRMHSDNSYTFHRDVKVWANIVHTSFGSIIQWQMKQLFIVYGHQSFGEH